MIAAAVRLPIAGSCPRSTRDTVHALRAFCNDCPFGGKSACTVSVLRTCSLGCQGASYKNVLANVSTPWFEKMHTCAGTQMKRTLPLRASICRPRRAADA